MPDLYTINRYILLIRPSEAMVKWINSLDAASAVGYEPEIRDDNTDVYLIPEFDHTDEARAWLKDNYLDILENTLETWTEDTDEWPDSMSWDTFESFLDYSIQSNVLDTVPAEMDFDDDDEGETGPGFAAEEDNFEWE